MREISYLHPSQNRLRIEKITVLRTFWKESAMIARMKASGRCCTGQLSEHARSMLAALRRVRNEKQQRINSLCTAMSETNEAGKRVIRSAMNHAKHCTLGG